MKTKKILLLVMLVFACLAYAQRIDKQEIFVATSEEEMYKLYNQLLDSSRVSNRFLSPSGGMYSDYFGFSFFYELESRDTIMKIVQRCEWKSNDEYICDRFYPSYISNSMPIDFYERFLNYLEQLNRIENYFIKDNINGLLFPILRIVINQYESGILNNQDSIKARELIEETILRLINDDHNYRSLRSTYDKYMTDNIRQALVNVIDNPFYPTEYLDFFMSQQDTTFLDTTGIPPNIHPRFKERLTPEELEIYEKELPLLKRLQNFRMYERIGREEYNGLSAGQAYLQRKRDWFYEKGYLQINHIEDYANEKQDELLLKHLKEFKKKHLEEFNKQVSREFPSFQMKP